MANTIQGKNIIAYMKVDGTYYPVFCGKTLRFSLEQDELETTNVNSGSSREYVAGMANAMLEISGVSTSNNTNGRIAITYLQQQSVRQQIQDWKIDLTDDAGSTIHYTFRGIIRNTDFDKTIPGYSTSNAQIRVSGNVTIDSVAPPPSGDFEVFSDYWLGGNGHSYINGASTGNTDGTAYTLAATDIILAVEVEDQTMYEVNGTPAAGSPEYKWNTATLKVEFSTGMVFTGSERIFVMFKRPV